MDRKGPTSISTIYKYAAAAILVLSTANASATPPPSKYKRWNADRSKHKQRSFAIGHTLQWLTPHKPVGKLRALHLPGGQAGETKAILEAGFNKKNVKGLERDAAIAAEARQSLAEMDASDVEVIERDVKDRYGTDAWGSFDYVSLDYTAPFDIDYWTIPSSIALNQKIDRWVLHLAYLGKRDRVLPILRSLEDHTHTQAELEDSLAASWPTEAPDLKNLFTKDPMGREQRARALLETGRTALSLHVLKTQSPMDGKVMLKQMLRFEAQAAFALRGLKLDPGPVRPEKRWAAIEANLKLRGPAFFTALKEKLPPRESKLPPGVAAASEDWGEQFYALGAANSIATLLLQGAMGRAAQKSDVDYFLMALSSHRKRTLPDFAVRSGRAYAYTSDSGAPMIGFVALVERIPPDFLRALERLASAFGFDGYHAKIPGRERLMTLFEDLERTDPGIVRATRDITFTEFGGETRPRLTKKAAIAAFRDGTTIPELTERFLVSPRLLRSLPAIKAHVTMGTYKD